MMKLKLALLLLCSIGISKIHAFESMSRKGYSSCIACHVSSSGGGSLTAYGKLISDSTAMIKMTRKFDAKKPFSWGLQARVANLRTENDSETFPMQADLLASYMKGAFKVTSNLARAPKRSAFVSESQNPSTIDTLYVRELMLSYQYKKEVYFNIGRRRQNVGLNLQDHTLYTKSLNKFNITDLTTLVSVENIKKESSMSFSLFVPSYQEDNNEQEYGAKAQYRVQYKPFILGAGLLYGKTDFIDRYLLNAFLKISFKPVVVFSENVFTRRLTDQSINFNQNVHLLGVSFFPMDYLELFSVAELLRREDPFFISQERLGVGFNYRIQANVSLRFDFKRSFLSQIEDDLIISQLFINGW